MKVVYDEQDIKKFIIEDLRKKGLNMREFEFVRYGELSPSIIVTVEDEHE